MRSSSDSFEALVHAPLFRRLCALVREITGVRLLFVEAPYGRKQLFDRSTHKSNLCVWMHRNPAFLAKCHECNRRHVEQVASDPHAHSYRCHAGLVDYVIPVFLEGRQVGAFLGGEMLPQAPTERRFKRFQEQLHDYGFNQNELRRRYFQTPWIGSRRRQAILQLIEFMASYVSETGPRLVIADRPQEASAVERACAFIHANIEHPFSLSEVGRAIGVAPNYLSGLFRQEKNEPFVSYVRRLRVERAKRLLRETELPVIQIAMDTGFGSLRSFNRAFLHVCGVSPRAYRATHHPPTVR